MLGPPRSTELWQRVSLISEIDFKFIFKLLYLQTWTKMKQSLKAKVARINVDIHATGGERRASNHLTLLDERLVEIFR